MKTFYLSYLKNFNCIADKCPDTCCAGWTITIDKNTLSKYKTVAGDFGKTLKKSILKFKNPCFKLNKNRCCFLDENNLCQIYSTLGKDYLTEVCYNHPRFISEYGNIREITLSLSCPESVRLLFEETDLTLIEETDDTPPTPNNIDPKLFNYLNTARDKILKFLSNKNLTAKEVLASLTNYQYLLQDEIDDCTYIDTNIESLSDYVVDIDKVLELTKILSKCDIVGNEFKNTLNNIKTSIKDENFIIKFNEFLQNTNATFINKILTVYIFRYFLTAIYDANIINKFGFCLLSYLYILLAFYIEETTTNLNENHLKIVSKYSREICHCDKNVNLIEKSIKKINL